MSISILKTDDGSDTLFNSNINESYHSTFGAISESLHVFIKNGLEKLNLSKINVFEVGFGTGLNALLSAIYAQEHKVLINYFSIEQFPIDEHIIQKLNYGHFSRSVELYRSINLAPWNVSQEISPFFTINKLNQDLISFDFEMIQCCDIVFFDAFSPSKQPEMWQPGIFRNIFNILNSKGLLVTYTAAGVVKNALREAGFTVKRLKGPPGKHHMLSAEKQ